MCKLCDEGRLRNHFGSRRNFLKGVAATGVAAAGLDLFCGASCGGRRWGSALRQRPAGPALPHPRRFGDVAGPAGRQLRAGRRAGRGQEDPCRRAEPACGRRRGDRRLRPHRHAGLHRYAPSPVRDGAAELSRRRAALTRHAGRGHRLLPLHSANLRPGVPAAGCVHQRAVQWAQQARRRRHDSARHLADPSLAGALRRRDPGPHRCRPPRGLRLFRERGRRSWQPVSDRRGPHQKAVVLL